MVCTHCADMDLVGHYLTAISQRILISTNMGCCLGKKHQPLPHVSSLKAELSL